LWLANEAEVIMPEQPERELIKYDGVQIEVLLRGRGPLIVMLPSGGRGAEDFDAVAAGLAAEGFRVACPQPRGIGASTGPMNGISLHDLAIDVAAVIRHESGAPAVVVGHAYGNWVARMTAADYPELVRGTVIAAAGIKDYPKDIADAVVRCAQPNLPEHERLASLRIAFFATGNDPSVWLGGWYPEVMRAQHQASLATSPDEYWKAGKAPLLDLPAADDPFRPPASREDIQRELGADRVTVVVIPNASHSLMPEQPAATAKAIAEWVRPLGRP
jgi:pimeloyl-ACP methyl ester carboxylesterase